MNFTREQIEATKWYQTLRNRINDHDIQQARENGVEVPNFANNDVLNSKQQAYGDEAV